MLVFLVLRIASMKKRGVKFKVATSALHGNEEGIIYSLRRYRIKELIFRNFSPSRFTSFPNGFPLTARTPQLFLSICDNSSGSSRSWSSVKIPCHILQTSQRPRCRYGAFVTPRNRVSFEFRATSEHDWLRCPFTYPLRFTHVSEPPASRLLSSHPVIGLNYLYDNRSTGVDTTAA
jgi:hypothetical protein